MNMTAPDAKREAVSGRKMEEHERCSPYDPSVAAIGLYSAGDLARASRHHCIHVGCSGGGIGSRMGRGCRRRRHIMLDSRPGDGR